MAKNKDKENIKSSRDKQQFTYKETPIRVSAEFSAETAGQKGWLDIFKVIKGKSLRPRIFYPARLSLKFEKDIKSFTYQQKLRNSAPRNQLYKKF